jgi:mono/diheme cytochrome c family protein
MKKMIAAFAAALFLAPGAQAADAAKGKQLFLTHGCFQCHGTQGQGGSAGAKLAPDPIPQETFVGFVRSTNGAMPPYRAAILSDADLGDIYAYLQSIPKPADPKSIPLLGQ